MTGRSKHGNDSSGSIKCGEFLYSLRTGELLKRDCSMEYVSIRGSTLRTVGQN